MPHISGERLEEDGKHINAHAYIADTDISLLEEAVAGSTQGFGYKERPLKLSRQTEVALG